MHKCIIVYFACRFLCDDSLVINGEEMEVFNTICNWVQHDPGERSQYVCRLMKHVRFPRIPADILLDEVLKVLFFFDVSCHPQFLLIILYQPRSKGDIKCTF